MTLSLIATPADSAGATLSLHALTDARGATGLAVKPAADGSGSAVTSWTSGASKYVADGLYLLKVKQGGSSKLSRIRVGAVTDVPDRDTTRAADDDSTAVATTGFVQRAVAVKQISTQTGTAYTLVLADGGKVVRMTAAGAAVVTVPLNATVAFPIGTVIDVYSGGAGGVTITPAGGATIRGNGTPLSQYGDVRLRKDGTDEWVRR